MYIKDIMDRDEIVKLNTVEVVLDKITFEEVYLTQPFVCSLLLDNFKTFLSDLSFGALERQLALCKFLQNNYPLEVTREIISYVNDCSLSDDYNRIIMEWNYNASDYIKQASLYQYDAAQLAFDKETMELYNHKRQLPSRNSDAVIRMVRLLVDKKKNEE